MPSPEALSAAQVRRIALRAQGFQTRRPARPGAADIRRMVQRLGALQIDAVNVLVRSHYLPLFSRLGPYPVDALDRLVYRTGAAFEYWAHAASVVAIEVHPALRWRMARYATHPKWAGFLARVERERPGYVDAVYAEVKARGPMTFSELTDPARRPKNPRYAATTTLWDRGSDGKSVLEYLYDSGALAVAERQGFNRAFDLAERVIPAGVLDAPALAEPDAQRTLVRHAGTALGVATIGDLADYFRLPVAVTRARVRELVDAGEFVAIRPEGWAEPGYLDVPSSPSVRHVQVSALLSPFDSLVWDRKRTARVFGFQHSFELYVPAARRRFGYYVLPYVLGDQIVARVDLKADRSGGTLLVPGAFLEAGHAAAAVACPLAAELRAMADWLGLGDVVVSANGDLAPALTAEVARAG